MRARNGSERQTDRPVYFKQSLGLALVALPLIFWWVRSDREPATPEASQTIPKVALPAPQEEPSQIGVSLVLTASAMPQPQRRQLVDDAVEEIEWDIPSGLTNVQIAQRWEEGGYGASFEFLAALSNERIAEEFGATAPMTEGWILSDTYRFAKRTPAKTVVRMMLTEYRQLTEELFRVAATRFPDVSEREMVTLASIIEKESRNRADRRRVSSVYHNRLRQGMRLEADPTLARALGYPDRQLRNRDRWVQSPHNTYKNGGLPPEPLCNISLDCLDAAVYPVETNYLFFVSMGNGRHYYSRTYGEHLAAVERYRSARLANAR